MTALDAGSAGQAGAVSASRPAPRLRDHARPERPDTVARAGLFLWTPVWLSGGIGGWFALRQGPGAVFYAVAAMVAALSIWVGVRAVAWAETGRLGEKAAGWARALGFAAALVATGVIGFGLWVHHMFATGLPNISLGFFSAASEAVAIPTAVQIFAFIATLWAGRVVWSTPILFGAGSLAIFVIDERTP